MKFEKNLVALILMASTTIVFSPTAFTNEIPLTNERLVGGEITKPTLGLDDQFLEGTITFLNQKKNQLVIRDQSILITPKTSFTSDKRVQPISFGDLKRGNVIRVNTVYEKGEKKAISVHELDRPLKNRIDPKNTNETGTMLLD